jgi:lysophospholipase L1-like esterase
VGLFRTAWLLLGVGALLLVTLELLMRAYRETRANNVNVRVHADGYDGAPWVKEYFQELARSDNYRWESYVYWRHVPLQGKYIHVNARGLRETWCGDSNTHTGSHGPQGKLTIWVFGGSTVWGMGARDQHTIPSELCGVLSQRIKVPIEVVNFGEIGYVSTQEVIALLRELQRGRRPSVVIFCDGTNDTFAAFRSKTAGVPYGEQNRTGAFTILNATWNADLHTILSLAISRSAFCQLVPGFSSLPSGSANARDRESELPTDISERLAADVVRVYAANVQFIEALSRQAGFVALFYWQPVIFTKHHLTAYEQQQAQADRARRTFFLQVYEQMTRRTDISSEGQFYDLTPLFAEAQEPYFIDSLHLTETGNAIVAKQMAADISGILPERDRNRLP